MKVDGVFSQITKYILRYLFCWVIKQVLRIFTKTKTKKSPSRSNFLPKHMRPIDKQRILKVIIKGTQKITL